MEKETKELLTEEQLDTVAGGFGWENKDICAAIKNNTKLSNLLTKTEKDALDNISASDAQSIIANFLANKLNLKVEFETKGMTSGSQNGKQLLSRGIINAINDYKG